MYLFLIHKKFNITFSGIYYMHIKDFQMSNFISSVIIMYLFILKTICDF